MKYKHGWVGAVCCFVLFVVVCLFLTMNMKGAFRAAGHPEIGLLFFTLPGAVASFCSHRREVIKPLMARCLRHLVVCCSRVFSLRPLARCGRRWRGYSAPYSGALWEPYASCSLAVCSDRDSVKTNNALRRGRYDITHSTQANRFKFSFAQASKSVQPPMCF